MAGIHRLRTSVRHPASIFFGAEVTDLRARRILKRRRERKSRNRWVKPTPRPYTCRELSTDT
jgi:hypothetical protein